MRNNNLCLRHRQFARRFSSRAEPRPRSLWLGDRRGLEQPEQGRAGLQATRGRSSSVFTSCLWSVSAAHEGFPCHARVSRAIVQVFSHRNFS